MRNPHEITATITANMDAINGWEITPELNTALADTIEELLYADGDAAAAFLRDLAYTLDEIANDLN